MASEEEGGAIAAPAANESAAEAGNVESSASGKSRPRPSRSRCFRVYKWILVTAVIIMMILTLASTPWCIDLARELLHEIMNSTSTGSPLDDSGRNENNENRLNQTALITDTLVYGVVGISLLLTMIFLIFGLVAIWVESPPFSIIFSILLFICFGASICCYDRLLFLINMAIDAVLGLLVLLYAIIVKRADRLAPTEGSSPLQLGQEEDEKSSKKKQKKEKKPKKEKKGKKEKKSEEKTEEKPEENGGGGGGAEDEKV